MAIRHAWCAAAVVATAVGVTGCGGGGARPTATPTAGSQIVAISQTPTDSPTTAPTPATPEDEINAIAERHGWVLDDTNGDDAIAGLDNASLYATPADYVQDVCDSLPDQADGGAAQWLAQGQRATPDEMGMLKIGVPLLCPEWTKTVKQAASGHYPVYIGPGTFKVTSRRADDTVPPGTYRTTGDLSGCYWERTRANGDIIDNSYATAATRITVTILPSDDLFTSTDCGTWKPVG